MTAALAELYPTLKKISVDYALMEKSTNVVVVPATFDWDDVGAWPAIAKHFPQDAHGNVLRGVAMVEDGKNNIVVSDGGHLTAVVGCSDLVVVHTPEATLIVHKDKAQDIKALLKRLADDPAKQKFLWSRRQQIGNREGHEWTRRLKETRTNQGMIFLQLAWNF